MADEDLIALEQHGWQALAGDEGADFYDRLMTDDATMMFPQLGVLQREAIIESVRLAPPWARFELEDMAVRHVSPEAALVTYHAVAQREGQPEYEAYISSLYVRQDGEWRLAFHQQSATAG